MSWKEPTESLIKFPFCAKYLVSNDILKYQYNYLNRHINRQNFLKEIIKKENWEKRVKLRGMPYSESWIYIH